MIIYSFDESIHLSSNPRTQWIGKPVRDEITGVVIGQVVSMVNSSGLYQVSLDAESMGIFYAGGDKRVLVSGVISDKSV